MLQSAGTWGAAALTSGTMSAAGDALAQFFVNRTLTQKRQPPRAYEVERTLRMFGFGLLFYGPYQKWWYGMLAKQFPGSGVRSFICKVTLNQVALAPVVLAVVFSWNLALCGDAARIPEKLQTDLVPTMINGWKFWVPAAALNFYAIPLASQVLYMSTCGVLWTAYLSFASYNSANAIKDDAKPACCSSRKQ